MFGEGARKDIDTMTAQVEADLLVTGSVDEHSLRI